MLEYQLSSNPFLSTLPSPPSPLFSLSLLQPSHSLPDHLLLTSLHTPSPPSPPPPLPPLPLTSLPSPSPPVLQFHEVVASSECHQVGVVGRGGDGHRPSAPDVGVTQLVRQCLDVISCEVIVIPQHMVMGRPRCTLVGGGEGGGEGRGGEGEGEGRGRGGEGEGRGGKGSGEGEGSKIMIFYAHHTHLLGFSHFSLCAPPPAPPTCIPAWLQR